MSAPKDISGLVFGDYKAICLTSPTHNYGGRWWKCECVGCGDVRSFMLSDINNRASVKCRVCNPVMVSDIIKVLKGRYATMKNLSTGPKNPANIGVKFRCCGVGMAPEWLHDRQAFINWALGKGFNETVKNLIYDGSGDPVGPTTLSICSARDRALSRTGVRIITYNNESHNLVDWADIVNVQRATIVKRLDNFRWDIPEALFARPNQKKGTPIYDHKGNFVCNKT